MPRAYSTGKRDANESGIINFYRGVGAFVKQMSETAGFDLLVVYRGQTVLVEVKDPAKFQKKLNPAVAALKSLTKSELEFSSEVTARNGNYAIVWDIETAKKSIGL